MSARSACVAGNDPPAVCGVQLESLIQQQLEERALLEAEAKELGQWVQLEKKISSVLQSVAAVSGRVRALVNEGD